MGKIFTLWDLKSCSTPINKVGVLLIKNKAGFVYNIIVLEMELK